MTQFLPYLFLLACPVSMGLMMWWMMRSNNGGNQGGPEHHDQPGVGAGDSARIAELESQLNELKAELRSERTTTAKGR